MCSGILMLNNWDVFCVYKSSVKYFEEFVTSIESCLAFSENMEVSEADRFHLIEFTITATVKTYENIESLFIITGIFKTADRDNSNLCRT